MDYQQRRHSLSTNLALQPSESTSFGPTTIPVSDQQRSANPFLSAPSSSQSVPDQQVKAVQRVIDLGIRRGNRRRSMIETDFHSAVTTKLVRKFGTEISRQFFNELKNNGLTSERQLKIRGSIIKDPLNFTAYITESSKCGNCGEFSALVYSYIMGNTKDRVVYQIKLVGHDSQGKELDHIFVITTPDNNKKVSDTTEFDPQNAVVIDTYFNNKVQTLGQFYAGDNLYRMELKPNNLRITRSDISNGSKLNMTDEQTFIEKKVRDYMDSAVSHTMQQQSYKIEYSKLIDEGKKRGILPEDIDVFDFDRDKEVHDIRKEKIVYQQRRHSSPTNLPHQESAERHSLAGNNTPRRRESEPVATSTARTRRFRASSLLPGDLKFSRKSLFKINRESD